MVSCIICICNANVCTSSSTEITLTYFSDFVQITFDCSGRHRERQREWSSYALISFTPHQFDMWQDNNNFQPSSDKFIKPLVFRQLVLSLKYSIFQFNEPYWTLLQDDLHLNEQMKLVNGKYGEDVKAVSRIKRYDE